MCSPPIPNSSSAYLSFYVLGMSLEANALLEAEIAASGLDREVLVLVCVNLCVFVIVYNLNLNLNVCLYVNLNNIVALSISQSGYLVKTSTPKYE